MHLFLMSSLIKRDEQKGSHFVGQHMLQLLGPESIPNDINVFRKEGSDFWLISEWFVHYLASLWVVWLVCGWFGCFVGGLAVLWVVSSFTASVEEDKNKSFIFASKREIKSARKLNAKYKNMKIKQHSRVTYLGCVLD